MASVVRQTPTSRQRIADVDRAMPAHPTGYELSQLGRYRHAADTMRAVVLEHASRMSVYARQGACVYLLLAPRHARPTLIRIAQWPGTAPVAR